MGLALHTYHIHIPSEIALTVEFTTTGRDIPVDHCNQCQPVNHMNASLPNAKMTWQFINVTCNVTTAMESKAHPGQLTVSEHVTGQRFENGKYYSISIKSLTGRCSPLQRQ